MQLVSSHPKKILTTGRAFIVPFFFGFDLDAATTARG